MLFCSDELVTNPPHVDDAQAGILSQTVSQLGDEDVQALVVKETVVAPQFQQQRLRCDHLAGVQAQAMQNFTLTIG